MLPSNKLFLFLNKKVKVSCVVSGCSWTLQRMRELNSSVVLEPSDSTGELCHRFLTVLFYYVKCTSKYFSLFMLPPPLFLQDSHEQCVQWIVRFIHTQRSPKRISFLYDCLAMAVETSLLPPRFIHIFICPHLSKSTN